MRRFFLIITLMLLPAVLNAQAFTWAKSMGGANDERTRCVSVDSAGNVYTCGYFNLTGDFDPGPANFNLISTGG